MEKGHTYTLDEFRNAQFEQLEEVCTLPCHYFVTCLCASTVRFFVFMY